METQKNQAAAQLVKFYIIESVMANEDEELDDLILKLLYSAQEAGGTRKESTTWKTSRKNSRRPGRPQA